MPRVKNRPNAREVVKKLDTENIQYVVYCRKSTDESSWQQKQSIPDQIKACVAYAKNSDGKVSIMKKNDLYKFFDDEKSKSIDDETDLEYRHIYKDTQDLFIIQEQQSAKKPWERPKWNKLMKLIEEWKIEWILSYSPDRQARNMVEWWVLIDFVDRWKLDLKYTNFHFENSASGKMMLWIWFVFSKQYSDKLSEDIGRWNQSRVLSWKSLGAYKHWYYRDENWYYRPYWKAFELIQKAFKAKIYDHKSDDDIVNILNAEWYKRKYIKSEKDGIIRSNQIYKLWIDPFYYGRFISGNNSIDLRDDWVNPYYQPVITEEEHLLLVERYEWKSSHYTVQKRQEKFEETTPISKWVVISEDNMVLSDYIPNPARFSKKLLKLKQTNPNLKLGDIILSNQIRYKCSNKKSPNYGLEVTFAYIEKEIINLLLKMKISDTTYNQYVDYIKWLYNTKMNEINEENTRLHLRINHVRWEKQQYIEKNMAAWIHGDEEEKKIYEKKKRDFENKIETLKSQVNDMSNEERNSVVEFEMFLKILSNASKYYSKWTYVQKRQISDIFISNIVITPQKQVIIKARPWLEDLFSGLVKVAGFEPASESHAIQRLPS